MAPSGHEYGNETIARLASKEFAGTSLLSEMCLRSLRESLTGLSRTRLDEVDESDDGCDSDDELSISSAFEGTVGEKIFSVKEA